MAGGHTWKEVGETATEADGTHPTGMHSCLLIWFKAPCKKSLIFINALGRYF